MTCIIANSDNKRTRTRRGFAVSYKFKILIGIYLLIFDTEKQDYRMKFIK